MPTSSKTGRRGTAAILAAALFLAAAAPPAVAETDDVAAEEAAAAAVPSMWERALYKTLTYEFMANTADVLILSALTGGIGSVGVGFMTVNVLTAATAYYSHEIAWDVFGPEAADATYLTTAAKTVTYRAVSSGRSFGLAYLFAGDAAVASAFAIAGNVADTLIYVGNELAWDTFAPRPPHE